jgi:hypothetical protein
MMNKITFEVDCANLLLFYIGHKELTLGIVEDGWVEDKFMISVELVLFALLFMLICVKLFW